MSQKIIQRDDLIRALREAGDVGVHTCEMRAVLGIGNPSQRLSELEDEGYVFRKDWQPFGRNQTRGKRVWLVGAPSGPTPAVEAPPRQLDAGEGLPVGGSDRPGRLVRPLASLPDYGGEMREKHGALLPGSVRRAPDVSRDARVGDGREPVAASDEAGGVMSLFDLYRDEAA